MTFAWIIIGIMLIAIGILLAMPFFGLGLVIPILGDVIDIPISIILILLGAILLTIGGMGYLLSQFWWIIVIGFAVWYLLFVIKIGVSTKRAR